MLQPGPQGPCVWPPAEGSQAGMWEAQGLPFFIISVPPQIIKNFFAVHTELLEIETHSI